MKRNARRALAVTLGLVLGWSAAGWTPGLLGGGAVGLAQAAEGGDAPGDAHQDTGLVAARELVPRESVSWYPGVLAAAALLFVAAVVLGIPALRLRGPLPPDPAEGLAHDEGHHAEDHGGGAHTRDPHGGHPEPVTSAGQAHGGH